MPDSTGASNTQQGSTQQGKAQQGDGRQANARQGQASTTSNEGQHLPGHGNSVAAWTGVGVVLLGSAICCIAVVATSLWMFVGGLVVVALGAVVGKVLAGMGYGSNVPHDPPSSPRQGVR